MCECEIPQTFHSQLQYIYVSPYLMGRETFEEVNESPS